ncbi:NupC/NupG family nucleoside CNT transporter [Asaia bogorensis]|uniref:Nucleoside permease n=1 Tax=Asaia bogorensis NBRC 16594 TaxID=1231624 RepID=A0AAN4R1A2_9PROT|nr:nucleoside transporter C-terminal domain-containing protein [Asaia bogorensis]MDR6182469.1 CNT family concentrative nucleoside transporter [Asaia bogorensis NBRC 16594]BAT20066.1 nucleoside permease [Asaia bogorensis NBRC 16594]GBQ80546.1 nucleoside permease [Asaia bogorensis NBRC 16594]GEL52515.1 nucleoside permease [Asaia bogorensis NBRC 16594]
MFLRGLVGMAVLIALGVLLSSNRRAINFRQVGIALALQCGIGALALFVPWGRRLFGALADGVGAVLAYGQVGTHFLFGGLAGPKMDTLFGQDSFVFAFQVLPAIVYVSALIALFYHWGVMQALARIIGQGLCRVLGTTAIESFSAVMTVFLGQSEMPVVLRPYVNKLRRAELFTIMSSGTASVSGSVLAGYAGLGVPMHYLLAASFMAIPGGLLFAKILWPTPEDAALAKEPMPRAVLETSGVFDALAEGAMSGARVAFAVGAVLVAFVGITALVDGVLHGLGGWLHLPGMSLSTLLGGLMAPLAWLIGIPWADSLTVGGLLGQKIAFNEFVAYVGLSPLIHAHALSAHSLAIVSVALCGFSNFSSVGILIGGFGSVAPERRAEIATIASRCVIAGTLSNLMSATITGLFIAA